MICNTKVRGNMDESHFFIVGLQLQISLYFSIKFSLDEKMPLKLLCDNKRWWELIFGFGSYM